jgi:hypothetical protein
VAEIQKVLTMKGALREVQYPDVVIRRVERYPVIAYEHRGDAAPAGFR